MSLDFLQNTTIRVGLVVGVAIFLLSALVSSIAGAGLLTILWRALLFGVLMGGLSAGLIEVLRKTVPEVIEIFEEKSPLSSENNEESLFAEGDDDDFISNESLLDEENGGGSRENILIDEDEVSRKKSTKPRKKPAKEGDIIAEGVALENNPELMAEAVKHILDTDKDET